MIVHAQRRHLGDRLVEAVGIVHDQDLGVAELLDQRLVDRLERMEIDEIDRKVAARLHHVRAGSAPRS